MKAVIQRVKDAVLSVDGKVVSQIAKGLVVYFGVEVGDDVKSVDYFASKIANMRIFSDDDGKMNYSVLQVGGEVLAVSQFTLLANTRHGNRPDFLQAEKGEIAFGIYDGFCNALSDLGVAVKRGVFGADMLIEQSNDGPVTIILENKQQ